MLGIVNEDFKLKNHKSLEMQNGLQKNKTKTKTKTKSQTPVQKTIKTDRKSVNYAINEKEYQADDISDTSSSSEHSSSVSSPRSTINDMEEINVRMLIGDKNSSKEIQNELDSILSHIQFCDDSETICV